MIYHLSEGLLDGWRERERERVHIRWSWETFFFPGADYSKTAPAASFRQIITFGFLFSLFFDQ